MKAPFPWFGGKSRVAHLVWERFGDVPNYVEPFAGSLAVLLGRQTSPRVETVNDIDCWIANFFRALQADPEGLASWASWPINEADLHARHVWLVNQVEFRERMKTDPDYFDVKIAGWWCWGLCQWIGSGWCCSQVENGESAEVWTARPWLTGDGMGIHKKMPYAGRDERGALSRAMERKRPRINRGDSGILTSRQIPTLGGDGSGSGRGLLTSTLDNSGLTEWLSELAVRLRRVRVCCGDWSRIVGPSVTHKIGVTGVFLDPPYDMRVVGKRARGDGAAPSDKLYAAHDNDVSAAVCKWAIENGDHPKLKIAVCGYEGEHDFPSSWECVPWKSNGGFGNQAKEGPSANKHRERIWFSPRCQRRGLLDLMEADG